MEKQIQNQQEDEISLIDIFVILLRYKWILALFTILGIIFALIYPKIQSKYFTKPNTIYSSCINVFVSSSNNNYNDSSKLGNLAIFLSSMEDFINDSVNDFYCQNNYTETYSELEIKKIIENDLDVKYNGKNSILTLKITNSNKNVVNDLIDSIFNSLCKNMEKLNFDNIFHFINGSSEIVKRNENTYIYQILIVFVSFSFSILIIFVINAINNLKNDKEAMRKLFPKKHTDKDS